jgi:Uma2 family endonuclease
MGSKNHAIVQVRLGAQLSLLGDKYTGAINLSLDMSTSERQEILKNHGVDKTMELEPDLVLYNFTDFGFISASKGRDKERVMEVPLLCVEIISPDQSSTEILKKFGVYFELGVQSCWYVDSALTLVRVYEGSLTGGKDFIGGALKDDTLEIEISLKEVFRR